jgi:hypothetical protein
MNVRKSRERARAGRVFSKISVHVAQSFSSGAGDHCRRLG